MFCFLSEISVAQVGECKTPLSGPHMNIGLDHDRWIIQIEQFSGPHYSCDHYK